MYHYPLPTIPQYGPRTRAWILHLDNPWSNKSAQKAVLLLRSLSKEEFNY
jgi:hypothetical protein